MLQFKVQLLLILCLSSLGISAQDFQITLANGHANPQHTDNIGSIARSANLYVEGTYVTENIQSITFKLLTYQKSPYTKLLGYEVVFDNVSELNGTLDEYLTVPADYMLGGNPDNTQFLQVKFTYTDKSSFANLNLTVTDKQKTLIDFDAEYGTFSGATLVNKINEAISSANNRDTILFKSAFYDFEGSSLNVEKAVCLSGVIPAVEDLDNVGAYGLNTIFTNLKRLGLKSSSVKITNLNLQAHSSTGYVFTDIRNSAAGNSYSNILFDNVLIENGKVQVFGGNGAGVRFSQVSFVEFTQGGYYLNRSERVDNAPQFIIEKCFFKPKIEAINFNVRAISLDAGNTEYPVVWDQQGSTINNSLMDGTGLGVSSKCANVNVTNCHFLGYRADVDMIHIEEFGYGFLIDGNIFEHKSPARGINIDREIQQCHDITITNNKWVGEYAWIISAHSPYNLVMENNDFTEAWAKNASDIAFDFTYDHGEELQFTKYDMPAYNIVFKNNTGLDATKDGYFKYKALANDNTIDIEYPASKLTVVDIDQAPQTIINCETTYRIRNKENGEFLCASSSGKTVELKSGEQTDNSDIWTFSFKYPYFYHVKNEATQNYLEVYRGYTMGDYNSSPESLDVIDVEQEFDYVGKEDIPIWYLRNHNDGGAFFELLPGGNERKSRAVKSAGKVILEFAKENNHGQVTPELGCSWELLPTDGSNINDNDASKLLIYPNPAHDVLNVDMSLLNANEQYLKVFNAGGTLVYNKMVEIGLSRIQVPLQNLSPGIYMLQLSNSESQINKKFIVN